MTDDDLDRLLGGHDDVVPSSGFADAVMAAVRHEAWKTPPLPFPWTRVALGTMLAVLVVALAVASGVVRPAALGSASSVGTAAGDMVTALSEAAGARHLGWIALAMFVTLGSVGLSNRLASRLAGHE